MRFRRVDGSTHEVIDGEAVVLDPDASSMTVLNRVAAELWEALAEARSAVELTEVVRARYPDAPAERLLTDIEAFLAELTEAGLVTTADADG